MTVKMTDSKIRSLLKNKETGRHAIGDGLYLRVTPKGSGLWVVRYLINNKRREISIGQYPKMGLANAKVEAAKTQLNIENQIDPLAEKQRLAVREFNTVNDLAEDWLEDCAMLGESIARALDHDYENAEIALEHAKNFLTDRNREKSRENFFNICTRRGVEGIRNYSPRKTN